MATLPAQPGYRHDGSIGGQHPLRIAAWLWFNRQQAGFFLLSAGFWVDAAVGVIAVAKAQVRMAVRAVLGLDVVYLAFVWPQGFFAVDAQAALIGIQVGLDLPLDRLKRMAGKIRWG